MIKRIIEFAVYLGWTTVLLVIAAAAFGAWALTNVPIDAVPDITNNQVQINARAPSLTANEMEKQVTYLLENAVAGIPGLESTRSLSRSGFAQVTAVFGEKVDIYFARQQVNERLTAAKEDFPPGVETRLGPIATGLSEIYMWTVRYDTRAPIAQDGEPGLQRDGAYITPEGEVLRTEVEKAAYLRTLQDWVIRPQIKTTPGVAGVDSLGGYVKQYQVMPDPAKLFALGLSFSDLASMIERNNVSRGAGYVERNGDGLIVKSGGRLETIDDIRKVVVMTGKSGNPVHIGDIAAVGVGRELRTGSASMNGEEAVIGTALMLIGGNSRTVSAGVDAKLHEVAGTLPAGIEVKTVLNRTLLVDATIKTVAKNLLEGASLVILVLFLLLGNFRAALITAMVIPVTMLLLAIGMVGAHISANLMSLGALDFGLIADGAVIIAENSLRRLAERQGAAGRELTPEDRRHTVLTLEERLRTVVDSTEEMIKPTVYGQAIITLVYAPMLTFSGVEGKMFQPMAITVIIALISAFVLSLTFVPALIAIFVTQRVDESENAIVRGLKAFYRPLLARAMDAPFPTIGGGVAAFLVAVLLFSQLGQEFVPTLDEKNLAMQANRIPSASLTQSQAMQLQVEKAIVEQPQVAYAFSKTGTAEVATDPMPPNLTDTFIMLKPQEEWPDPHLAKDNLIAAIKARVDELPGNAYDFTQPIQLRFNELLAGARGDVAVKIFGENFDVMLKIANQIAATLRTVEGAADVKVEQIAGLPLLDIKIDKQAIGRLGLSLAAVQDVIGAAIGGQQAGVIFEGDRRFPIMVRLGDDIRDKAQALENIPISLPSAGAGPAPTILLKQIAQFSVSEGRNQISRENGKRRVTVTANVRGRDIGSVVAEAQRKVAAKVPLPSGYWLAWGGQFENLAAARTRLEIVVPICFFMIFVLLYSALGGARDALLVFSAVPLALSGGVAALWLRGMPMSVSAAVGFIALSGVAVLNGLVMRTYIRQLIENGYSDRAAIREGAMTRLRPVAMTALVASLGFLPMALATGTGAEVQKPIATVVIGGLISATLLTLLMLPALYTLFAGREAASHPAPTAPRAFAHGSHETTAARAPMEPT
jgi:heavy metal efflux system protein